MAHDEKAKTIFSLLEGTVGEPLDENEIRDLILEYPAIVNYVMDKYPKVVHKLIEEPLNMDFMLSEKLLHTGGFIASKALCTLLKMAKQNKPSVQKLKKSS